LLRHSVQLYSVYYVSLPVLKFFAFDGIILSYYMSGFYYYYIIYLAILLLLFLFVLDFVNITFYFTPNSRK